MKMYPKNTLQRAVAAYALLLTISSPLQVTATFSFDYFSGQQNLASNRRESISYQTLENILLTTPNPDKIREWSLFYTSESHFTGEGQHQAEWTAAKWKEFGIEQTTINTQDAILTYPKNQRLAVLDLNSSAVVYEAVLMEDTGRPSSGKKQFLHAFHAFSGEGNVTAQFVYANFGLDEDFQDLLHTGIDLEGKIAVVKSPSHSPVLRKLGRDTFRATSVYNAQNLGIAGLVIYSDPQNDEEFTEANGYLTFPDGPARAPTAIERGRIGNPMILPKTGNITTDVNIPTIPISYADAIPILKQLNGHGPLATDFDERWHGSGLYHREVQYNIGPSPENVVLNLHRNEEITKGSAYNVIGTIEGGALKDEVVILGNHRDAWGPGASDSSSGSSALNEVARGLGEALRQGWRPLRTIVLASFDGAETGHAGAHGWMAENLSYLNRTVVAYLNVVVAGSGGTFHAQASPLLHNAIHNATSRVFSPNQTISGQKVLDVWGGNITPGSGGDGISFQVSLCISTVDFGFTPGPGDPPFPYHSLFDTTEWMEEIGDPNWEYHMATAKIWGLMTAVISETPVLAMNATDYAVVMHDSLSTIRSSVAASRFDSTLLDKAIQKFGLASSAFQAHCASLADRSLASPNLGWSHEVHEINKRYISLERVFSYTDNMTGVLTKHVVIPPTPYYMHKDGFPYLSEDIAAGNWSSAKVSRDIIIDRIDAATALLNLQG